MRKDLTNNIGVIMMLEPSDLVSTDTLTSIVDTAGYSGIEVDVIIGALTGVDSTNYLTPVLQECDTTEDDDFKAVGSDYMIGAFSKVDAATKDSTIQRVGYVGNKRYIRVKLDYTGSGITAGIVGAIGIVGLPSSAPVTAPAPITAS